MKARILEYRALPALLEQRNALLDEADKLLDGAKAETRALSDSEQKRFEEIKQEVGRLDATLEAEDERRAIERKGEKQEPEQRAVDEATFLKYLRGEQRALSEADNGGAIIPKTIANRIIEKVKELSPVYSRATVYNVGGNLVFPVYDEENSSISAAYTEEFTELTESTGKFTTVTLESHVVGCLAKISKSLMNQTDFDLVSFVVRKVSEAIAEFLERECLIGTDGKMQGVFSAPHGVTAAAQNKITADELIDLQDTVPDKLQANACWIMHKETRRAIRKLKNSDGDYLLNKDLSSPFGYTLLGKPVYVSESCPKMAAGGKAVVYGDLSALTVKLAQNVDIQVLMEKFATQFAVGVVGYIQCDSKIVEPQKLAVLTMAGGSAGA